MLGKKKCPSCGEGIEKKFNYCPYCGVSFKQHKESQNYGMIGRDDSEEYNEEISMPFGLDKLMNSLMKQFEKQISSMEGMPNGFKIKVSTGKPKQKKPVLKMPPQQVFKISPEEQERRRKLPKKEAESTLRRLPDRILYELEVPGVKSRKDILITKLENSIEIKAYSKDKCYIKTIPLKVEIIGHYLKDDKLFLELKN